MFSLFKRKNDTRSPEDRFWSWFIDNKGKIERFIDSDHSDYSIYRKLSAQIKNYNEVLFPEVTKTEDAQYVLIITPDGIKEGIEPTKMLAQAAPPLENWVIKKFRQPSDWIGLNFDGLEYPASDIEIIAELDMEREVVNIEVFITNMNEDEKKYQSLAFLYLDHILGEFNTITKVGYIDFHHLDKEKTVKDSITILELRNLIARELY